MIRLRNTVALAVVVPLITVGKVEAEIQCRNVCGGDGYGEPLCANICWNAPNPQVPVHHFSQSISHAHTTSARSSPTLRNTSKPTREMLVAPYGSVLSRASRIPQEKHPFRSQEGVSTLSEANRASATSVPRPLVGGLGSDREKPPGLSGGSPSDGKPRAQPENQTQIASRGRLNLNLSRPSVYGMPSQRGSSAAGGGMRPADTGAIVEGSSSGAGSISSTTSNAGSLPSSPYISNPAAAIYPGAPTFRAAPPVYTPAPAPPLRPDQIGYPDYVSVDLSFAQAASAVVELLGGEVGPAVEGLIVALQPDMGSGVTKAVDTLVDAPDGAGTQDIMDMLNPSHDGPVDVTKSFLWQNTAPETAPPSPKPSASEVLNNSYLTPPLPSTPPPLPSTPPPLPSTPTPQPPYISGATLPPPD
jgi:hypothetical protein